MSVRGSWAKGIAKEKTVKETGKEMSLGKAWLAVAAKGSAGLLSLVRYIPVWLL